MKKKDDLVPHIIQKLVSQASLINTAISSIADILMVLNEVLPRCSTEGCSHLAVGDSENEALCYHCCLASMAKGKNVEWRKNKESILRIEDSVLSLNKAGYTDPGDMH